MTEKITKKQISFTDRQLAFINEIRKEKGFISDSAVIHQALIHYHAFLFKDYVVARKMGGDISLDPETVAKRRVEIKSAEKKMKDEIVIREKRNICEIALHGEVVEGADGLYCKFKTYNYGEADEQKVPLEMVSEEFASHQNTDPTK